MKYWMLPMKLEESGKIKNHWMFSESVLDLQNCSVAFMDAKNGFLTKFHIGMVIQKNSQLFFFVEKKNIFRKWTNIFFQIHFFKKKNIFCSFSKIFFFAKKKSWEFFWITISMWNFVRNPFFASINETEQFWRSKTTSETFQKKSDFGGSPIFTGSIRYFIGSIQQKQICLKGSPSLTFV